MTKHKEKTKMTNMKKGNYPVGDFLIRIKNASMARKKLVEFPAIRFVVAIAKSLVREGYLDEMKEENGVLSVSLSFKKKEPLISDIKLVSKPGLRIYKKCEDLEAKRGPSIFIVSTPEGVVSSKEAIKKRLGGEVIAEVL